MGESYTFDELRAMGCPDSLLMQYIGWSKEEIDKLVAENQPQQGEEGE